MYDHNWKSFNNRMVIKYRLDDLQEMINRVRSSQERLTGLLKSLPAEDIFQDCGVCTENGYHVTISRLMDSIIDEEQEHLLQIQEFASHLEQQPAE